MNRTLMLAQLPLVVGLVAAAVVADGIAGGTYDLSWNTIDGGGGISTGGTYALTGTIGQPDANSVTLTGGTYALNGGFWPGATSVDLCPTDIDNDNSVSINDLLAVINTWGSCPLPCPPRCAADISPPATGDCAVNINDLLDVINSWGPCP